MFDNMDPLGIYLSNPSGEIFHCLNDFINEETASLDIGINKQYELTFDMTRDIHECDELFDCIQEGMYLFVETIGLFKMRQPDIEKDDIKETISITAISCDVELEDKEPQISINMGTEVSQEYLVEYNDGETEVLLDPYTNVPLDWIVLYNTFPEQLKDIQGIYHNGDVFRIKENEEEFDKLNNLLNTIPRLKRKMVKKDVSSDKEQLVEYVFYDYDDSGNIESITLSDDFETRVSDLIAFYGKHRDQLSLLSIVLEKMGGNWSIGDIYGVKDKDYSLANRKYQFEIDENIYSFFTQTLAQAINCVISFDIANRKVNITPMDKIGHDTGIVLSYDNLMNTLQVSSNEDNLCTRLYVTGADDLGIEQVNFGLPYIDDLSYKLNVRNSNGNRIYVSDDLAETYEKYSKDVEEKRLEYIALSKDYSAHLEKINELKYRVPNDSLKTDWGTFSEEELQASLTTYKNLLNTLITLYREDYGSLGLNSDDSINELYLEATPYWYDYKAYKETIVEIECAIATFPYYSDSDKWEAKHLEVYKDVNAWETEWSLYGSIELQAKITSYEENMKLLSESAVVLSGDSDDPYKIKTWSELSISEKGEYGNDNSKYESNYKTYQAYYNNRKEAKEYLDGILSQIQSLTNELPDIQTARKDISKSVSWESNFNSKEIETLNLLIRESNYNNENILVTSIDDSSKAIDIMSELLEDGKEQLSIFARPQLEFSVNADNLFALPEYENLWIDFKCGNYMLVQYKDDTYIKLRLVGYKFNPCLPSSDDFSITFSNYTSSRSKITDFESILGLASSSTSRSSGSGGSSGASGSYGESDDIDVTISNTMLAKLLNSETFGTRVKNVILDTIDVNALTTKYAEFGNLANGKTIIDGGCIQTGYICSKNYSYEGFNKNNPVYNTKNTQGSIINLDDGTFNFGGGALIWDGETLKVINGHIEAGIIRSVNNSEDDDDSALEINLETGVATFYGSREKNIIGYPRCGRTVINKGIVEIFKENLKDGVLDGTNDFVRIRPDGLQFYKGYMGYINGQPDPRHRSIGQIFPNEMSSLNQLSVSQLGAGSIYAYTLEFGGTDEADKAANINAFRKSIHAVQSGGVIGAGGLHKEDGGHDMYLSWNGTEVIAGVDRIIETYTDEGGIEKERAINAATRILLSTSSPTLNFVDIPDENLNTNVNVASSSVVPSGTSQPKIRNIGVKTEIRGRLTFSKTGSIDYLLTLPQGYDPPTRNVYKFAPCRNNRIARICMNTSGQLGCEWIIDLTNGSLCTGTVTWLQIDIEWDTDD